MKVPVCAAPPPPPCWRQVLRRGRKNLHEFLFPRLPGTKDRSAIVLSQFKTRFHLHSSKSTRLEFRFCSENHSGLDMINSSKSVTSFKIWRRLMYERVYFVYFFMNKKLEKMTHVEGIGDRQKGGGGNQHSYAETQRL